MNDTNDTVSGSRWRWRRTVLGAAPVAVGAALVAPGTALAGSVLAASEESGDGDNLRIWADRLAGIDLAAAPGSPATTRMLSPLPAPSGAGVRELVT
jgi:hypothetical protein